MTKTTAKAENIAYGRSSTTPARPSRSRRRFRSTSNLVRQLHVHLEHRMHMHLSLCIDMAVGMSAKYSPDFCASGARRATTHVHFHPATRLGDGDASGAQRPLLLQQFDSDDSVAPSGCPFCTCSRAATGRSDLRAPPTYSAPALANRPFAVWPTAASLPLPASSERLPAASERLRPTTTRLPAATARLPACLERIPAAS